MKLSQASELYSFNKTTYINLRWIAFIGQISAILFVQFILNFDFKYIFCLQIIGFGIITNLYLKFKINENQINNFISCIYLFYDIFQLGLLFFLTGGITNPFIFLIIIPAVFSSQFLTIKSSIFLVLATVIILVFLTFYHYELPHPGELHFHAPNYYFYAIPLSIIIGLFFLVYFAVQFGEQSRKRKTAYEKIQELMAKENELVSLGGQAAAAAHSLGTPLSTILLTAKEMQKDYKNDSKISKDLELLVSQSNRCSEILKKLSLNPNVNDEFLNKDLTFIDYINEIVRSFEEISNKSFTVNFDKYNNKFKIKKSSELIYGLRNFIGNANKFSKNEILIFISDNKERTCIKIVDDGNGFPKDLIDKHKLGEPYIRTFDRKTSSKQGLGLGTFIGKTLLEKNYATVIFRNSQLTGGAEVLIDWRNKDLKLIN